MVGYLWLCPILAILTQIKLIGLCTHNHAWNVYVCIDGMCLCALRYESFFFDLFLADVQKGSPKNTIIVWICRRRCRSISRIHLLVMSLLSLALCRGAIVVVVVIVHCFVQIKLHYKNKSLPLCTRIDIVEFFFFNFSLFSSFARASLIFHNIFSVLFWFIFFLCVAVLFPFHL